MKKFNLKINDTKLNFYFYYILKIRIFLRKTNIKYKNVGSFFCCAFGLEIFLNISGNMATLFCISYYQSKDL